MFADWIFSIVGIGALGVLLDVLMPEGETNKYIKSIFSLVTICVVISPLPKLINQEVEFDFFQESTTVTEVDSDFIKNVYIAKYERNEKEIESSIKSIYGQESDVKIVFVESCPEKIEEVKVFLKNMVIEGNEENKHIIEKIVSIIKARLNINEEQIVFRNV